MTKAYPSQITVPARFWAISQNNSGGVFDHNPDKGIGYAICVQALDRADAERRLQAIIDGYPSSGSCPCCGSRWSVWLEDEGSEQPELYEDTPLAGGWGIPSYIHLLNGEIDARDPEPRA